ncbi:hypothetical protein GDO78_005661 [Eleutherodactylus coqui]|uniref:Uncharacterized protein n=1 Tax=Eleutherodactylus coqui TaxID=57060 RepID=A0A8J6FKX2_ELECQ|nr:hypothetical protein GDO78_005661 [Eleutherodactylus coqui]
MAMSLSCYFCVFDIIDFYSSFQCFTAFLFQSTKSIKTSNPLTIVFNHIHEEYDYLIKHVRITEKSIIEANTSCNKRFRLR